MLLMVTREVCLSPLELWQLELGGGAVLIGAGSGTTGAGGVLAAVSGLSGAVGSGTVTFGSGTGATVSGSKFPPHKLDLELPELVMH